MLEALIIQLREGVRKLVDLSGTNLGSQRIVVNLQPPFFCIVDCSLVPRLLASRSLETRLG